MVFYFENLRVTLACEAFKKAFCCSEYIECDKLCFICSVFMLPILAKISRHRTKIYIKN